MVGERQKIFSVLSQGTGEEVIKFSVGLFQGHSVSFFLFKLAFPYHLESTKLVNSSTDIAHLIALKVHTR